MSPIHDFPVETLDGRATTLSEHAGKVVLIVNTASKCGLTPQFEGLEALHQRFAGRGFTVAGFPCNQFARQEPGDADAIGSFCQKNYGVTFPMYAKVDVNGADAHPLFQYLTRTAPGILGSRNVKWNFTKFLVGRDGRVLRRYAPATRPEKIVADIERALAGAPEGARDVPANGGTDADERTA